MDDQLLRHIELLHKYHLDLWTEVEAQIVVIRGAQEQIAKLRNARKAGESNADAHDAAALLSRHVQTLKGRIRSLGGTVDELEGTVSELLTVLATH